MLKIWKNKTDAASNWISKEDERDWNEHKEFKAEEIKVFGNGIMNLYLRQWWEINGLWCLCGSEKKKQRTDPKARREEKISPN